MNSRDTIELYLLTILNDLEMSEQKHREKVSCDQFGGDRLFGEIWKLSLIRLIFNIVLPIIMLGYDIFTLIRYTLSVSGGMKKIPCVKRVLISPENLYYPATRVKLSFDNDMWIILPFRKRQSDRVVNKMSIFSLLTMSEVVRCWLLSIQSHLKAVSRFGYGVYFLSVKSFEWFVIDCALRKIPVDMELVSAFQKDRLSILIDKLPHTHKTLIQHGAEFRLHNKMGIPRFHYLKEAKIWAWNLSYKHSSFEKIYCYSERDKAAFGYTMTNKPEFVITGYGFETNSEVSKKSVLIITYYSLCFESEKRIIRDLQNLDIELFVKGHPTQPNQPYIELQKNYTFRFVTGRNFPNVDLVISTDSTLAYEYESIGKEVIYEDDIDIKMIRNEVINKLNLIVK